MNTPILQFLKKKRENDPALEEDVQIRVKKTPSNVTFIEVQRNDSLLGDSDMPRKWSMPSMFHRRSRSIGRLAKPASSCTSYSTSTTTAAVTAVPKKTFSVRISPIILTGITGIKIDAFSNHKKKIPECDNTPKDTPVGYVRLWETESVVLDQGSREIVKSIPLPTGFLENDEKVTESIFVIWAQQKQKNGFFCTVNLFESDDPDCKSQSYKPAFIKLEIGVIIQGQECPFGVLVFDANSMVEGQHTVETQVVDCLEIPDCSMFMEKLKVKNRNHKFKYQLRSESSFRMRLVVLDVNAGRERSDRKLIYSDNGEQLWKAISVDSRDSENSVILPDTSPAWNVSTAALCGHSTPMVIDECDDERDTQVVPRERSTKMERFLPEVVPPKRFSGVGGSSTTSEESLHDKDADTLERNQRSELTSKDDSADQQEAWGECMFADLSSLERPHNENKHQSSNKMNFGRALASKLGFGCRSRSSRTMGQATSVQSVAQTSINSRISSNKHPLTYSSDADATAPLVFLNEIGIPTKQSASKDDISCIFNTSLTKQEPQSELKDVASTEYSLRTFSNELTQQESRTLGLSASTMSDFTRSVMSTRSLMSLSFDKLEQLAHALGMEVDELLDELSTIDDGTTVPKSFW